MNSTLGPFLCLIFVSFVSVMPTDIEPQKNSDSGDVAGSLDDEVSLLYSSQLQFSSDGIPLVTIGLMDNLSDVSISSRSGLTMIGKVSVGQNVRKRTIDTLGKTVWRFEVAEAIRAKVSYWCGVESLPYNKRAVLDRAVRLWQKRGESVQIFEVGSVFGIGGQVIDNRTYILGIKAFETEKLAEEHVQKTFSRYASRTFVHAHLDRRPAGAINMIDASGRVVQQFRDLVQIRSSQNQPIRVHRVEYGVGYRWHGVEDRDFAESILITLGRAGGLVVVNRISVDSLLKGLVPAEIFPTAPMEALKAQAVVARGEVFAKIGTRHFLDPYLLCASTHCQVYSGVSAEKSRTSQAVRQTRGELLFKDAQLVDSVYSACCGGHSEDNDVVWADPPSLALRGKPDMDHNGQAHWRNVSNRVTEWLDAFPQAYCSRSSFARPNLYRWKKTINSKTNRPVSGRHKANWACRIDSGARPWCFGSGQGHSSRWHTRRFDRTARMADSTTLWSSQKWDVCGTSHRR